MEKTETRLFEKKYANMDLYFDFIGSDVFTTVYASRHPLETKFIVS